MKKVVIFFLLICKSVFAGFSSSNLISTDTTLDYQHQFVGIQGIKNALGWLEISKNTKEAITLQVAPLHLQIIQPIWSIDKDRQSSISSFGIYNRSPFLVTFKSLYHDLNFTSISTIAPNSISSGIIQEKTSSMRLEGRLDFYSIANSAINGEAYGLLGGEFFLDNAHIIFSSIRSDFSDAYALKGSFNLSSSSKILIKEISAQENAYGIWGEKSGEGEIVVQNLNAKRGDAYALIGSVYGGKISFENISSARGKVYGVYNLSPSNIQATLEFKNLSSSSVYGVYNSSFLRIKESNLTFSNFPSNQHAIYSSGKLEIHSSLLNFSATPLTASISLNNNNLTLYDTTISSKTHGGIHSSSSSTLTLLDGGKLVIDTPSFALSGDVSLSLGENASLESIQSDIFIQKLQSKSGGKIILRSEDAKLEIHDFASTDTTFSLKATPSSNAMLEIHSSQARESLHNHLYVDLDSITLSPTQTTLAKVPQNLASNVVFNSLFNHGDSTKIISYVGFDEAEIVLYREEKDGYVYYTTDLVAHNFKINPLFILPTSIALNANHTLFLFSPSLSRIQEAREKKHGAWGKVKSGEGIERFQGNSQISYFFAQSGYDYNFCSLQSCNLLGVYVGYLRGISDQGAPSFGNIQNEQIVSEGGEIGIYHGYLAEVGVYWDSVFRGGMIFSELSDALLHNYFFSLSQEVGYRYETNQWFFQPKASLSLSYLTAQSLTQSMQGQSEIFTLTSKQRALWDFRSKLGGEIGYLFGNTKEGLQIGVGGYYVFDGFSGGEIELKSNYASYILSAYSSNHQGLLSLSLKAFLQNQTHLIVEFEKSFGGNLLEEYSLLLSLKFSFGASTSAPPNSSPKPPRTQEEPSEYKPHS